MLRVEFNHDGSGALTVRLEGRLVGQYAEDARVSLARHQVPACVLVDISELFYIDALGATLYTGVYAGIGYVFHYDLDRAAAYAGRVGTVLVCIALTGVIIYALRDAAWRRRLVGDLQRGTALLKVGIFEAQQKVRVGLSHRSSRENPSARWKTADYSESKNAAR